MLRWQTLLCCHTERRVEAPYGGNSALLLSRAARTGVDDVFLLTTAVPRISSARKHARVVHSMFGPVRQRRAIVLDL